MTGAVTDNAARSRFEMPLEDGSIAYVAYRTEGDILDLVTVKVPEPMEGKGHAARMSAQVFDILRERGQKAQLICPYLITYLKRNPAISDVVV